nr:reverse transcriptase domain-containing protein [Tanacetum cinerariifolium]
MSKKDKEKTAFHTNEGVFCYIKMTFGQKNAGATYQRLVDTIFEGQMGRNLEAYVDDMVIKSKTQPEMIKDVEETLLTLKKVNMMLNPKMLLRNGGRQILRIYSYFRKNQSKFEKNKGYCNTPKLGRSGIWDRGVLLHRSITQD